MKNTLKPFTMIAAAILTISCGGPAESDQTPADALLGRLAGFVGEGKIMFGHQDTYMVLSPFLWRAPPLEMRWKRREFFPYETGKGSLIST